ncbi:MAG: cytochrome c oxidase subunit 3 [Alphaproteobacteria bacterium]|nr:cytochrome c oxidase subunit 3 [Alphaproteobacteria bacterium]
MSTAHTASHDHGHSGHAASHPYHMVKPSPWPVVGAIAGGSLLGGVVLYMHGGHIWLMAIGFALVLATMYLWWRDVIREAAAGDHTGAVTRGLRFGMVLFISSEVMFFAAFFWAFFNGALTHQEYLGYQWPPEGFTAIPAWQLPFLNTLILLTSGATVTWAHHGIKHGDRKAGIYGLLVTILLGVSFLGIQGYEYAHAPFSFRGGVFPSTFFMATGFHGFHVTVGVLFLSVCLYRQIRGHFKPDRHIGFEAAAWYWHFVDVVWLFLFIWVYWWGG